MQPESGILITYDVLYEVPYWVVGAVGVFLLGLAALLVWWVRRRR
jgi:hypothetical protein